MSGLMVRALGTVIVRGRAIGLRNKLVCKWTPQEAYVDIL